MKLHLDHSLEAIDYQGASSPFAKELVNFFQELIDYRDAYKGTPKEIMEAVRANFNESKLLGILNKHSGLTYRLEIIKRRIDAMFATTLDIDESILSTMGYGSDINSRPSNFDEKLIELKKAFNNNDGTLNKSIKDSPLINLKVRMFFCLDSALFSSMYHIKAKDYNAVELAAIVLHEVGHNITMIDRMGYLHRTLTDFTKPVKINIKTIADAKRVLSETKSSLNKVDTSKTSNFYNKILSSLEEASEHDQIIRYNKLYLALVTVVSVFTIGYLTVIINLMIIGSLLSKIFKTKEPSTIIEKDSDFKRYLLDYTDIEFESDRFAVQHGVGVAIISGLDKLRINELLLKENLEQEKASKSLRCVQVAITTRLLLTNMGAYCHPGIHGARDERNKQIGKALIQILRSPNISSEVADHVIKQYKLFKTLDVKSNKMAKASIESHKKIVKVIENIYTVGGIFKYFNDGKQYKLIMDAARDLQNNELIVHKKQLERMV